ncbi:MAG TPA: hypothetical protein VLA89_14505 [Gemmatimonadales bacterium]|nr:hypothetical protein [Gemmatimonadales bacterium]
MTGKTGAWIMIFYTSTLHSVWALMIFTAQETLHTTPMWGLTLLIDQPRVLAATLIACAALAVVGGSFSREVKGLVMMLPQQMLLLASVMGILKAVAAGAYADGIVRSSLFILADQVPLLLIAPLYIFAIFYYHLHR